MRMKRTFQIVTKVIKAILKSVKVSKAVINFFHGKEVILLVILKYKPTKQQNNKQNNHEKYLGHSGKLELG